MGFGAAKDFSVAAYFRRTYLILTIMGALSDFSGYRFISALANAIFFNSLGLPFFFT